MKGKRKVFFVLGDQTHGRGVKISGRGTPRCNRRGRGVKENLLKTSQ